MITSFQDEYRFLSNFYSSEIIVGTMVSKRFPTVEHAYQYSKLLDYRDDAEYRKIIEMTPGQVKRWGRSIPLRTDWKSIRLFYMDCFVAFKFQQNEELQELLLATGDEEIIEGNNWGDRFWGMTLDSDNEWQGQNELGKILMGIRHILILESNDA